MTDVAETRSTAAGLAASELAAIESLRHMFDAGVPIPTVEDSPTADPVAPADVLTDGAVCPMPAFIKNTATSCPVRGDGGVGVEFGPADRFVRKLLRIQDPPANQSEAETYRHFRRSMTISGIRCTLTYVIFPFVLPLFSFMQRVGPAVGVLVGSVALVFDTLTVRRFFAANHKYRWYFSAVALSVMGLLTILLVEDFTQLMRELF